MKVFLEFLRLVFLWVVGVPGAVWDQLVSVIEVIVIPWRKIPKTIAMYLFFTALMYGGFLFIGYLLTGLIAVVSVDLASNAISRAMVGQGHGGQGFLALFTLMGLVGFIGLVFANFVYLAWVRPWVISTWRDAEANVQKGQIHAPA
jgi:hypothetical protein